MDEAAAALLLKAVRTLPRREQDQVLAALVREAFREPAAGVRTGYPPNVVFSYGPGVAGPAPSIGAPGQSSMLPVRLPPDLHERLRRWSADQGFSMASVIRGLVERFLDEQAGAAPRRKRATAKSSARKRPSARD